MDFRELNYVLAIAKHQNITKAADALYVSQPTLSKFLIALEHDLGIKLFRKSGHKYVLTYAGERYVEKAAEILRLKNDLDAEFADIIKRDVGILNVAFPSMRGAYMLPNILPAFRKVYPNVKVNIIEGNSDENDRRLLDGQIEISFCSKPTTLNPMLEYETLKEEEMLLCTCKNHPLGQFSEPNPASNYPRLDPALLKDELVLMMMPNQRTRQIIDDYLRKQGIKYENVMYTSNLRTIVELVAVGYGVSFVFETHFKHRRGETPVDCYSFGEPKTVSDFVVEYRKGSYLSTYAREFIEISRQFL